jgi:hypothetical protein
MLIPTDMPSLYLSLVTGQADSLDVPGDLDLPQYQAKSSISAVRNDGMRWASSKRHECVDPSLAFTEMHPGTLVCRLVG